VTAFVRGLLDRSSGPLVLDADALNAFISDPNRLRGGAGRIVIITPHPGEMGRLAGISPRPYRPTGSTSRAALRLRTSFM